MWSPSQSDRLFRAFGNHPRHTTVLSAATPGGPSFREADAIVVEQAIRARADEVRIPIVVRTLAVDGQPGYAHVVVYHVPDVTKDAGAALDSWNNEGGALPARARQPRRAG